MRQYDVYANPSAASRAFAPFIVILQSHYIELDTVVVAPLVTDKVASPIEIGVTFDGRHLVMALTELGSVRKAPFQNPVGSLLDHDYEIQRALGRLFSGF